jgi:1,4-alpha-glucan branching enzyme
MEAIQESMGGTDETRETETATVELGLFAPYNEAALVTGSFTDWRDVPMAKGDDGVFRAAFDLADGTYEYIFKVRTRSWFFEPGQWVTITDPYATDVSPENDNGVLRIAGGRRVVDEYAWRHDATPLPPDHELVIYEIHVGDFSGGEGDGVERGRFEHVVEKLDYLVDLGVNAVELMPVKEYPGDHSWGYNPRHFFATESSYGWTEDLKRLVDECHARGIRVLIDGVYNHAESACPLAHVDHDYWFRREPKDPEWNWGPEFDYGKTDEALGVMPARAFIGDAVRFWISEYHIDGIRYDAARQIGDFDFMRWVVGEAKRTAGPKPFYNVAEYTPPVPEITGPEGPMDGCWHDTFKHRVVGYLTSGEADLESLMDAIDARRLGFPAPANVVNFLANHDHERVLRELGDAGLVGEEAFRRARLGAALLMTAFGIPMLWMGQEFGEHTAKTVDRNKLIWRLLEVEENRALREHYRSLIALRRSHPALSSPNLEFVLRDDERRLLAFRRWSDAGDEAVVVVNFSGDFHGGVPVPVPVDGPWHEWTRDYDAVAEGGALRVDLGAREAHVFVRRASGDE